jgi:hypothetical protein
MFTTRDAVSLGCAGLAEGTNANTFKTSNILHYEIAGRSYVKAATDNVAFAAETALTSAFATQANKKVCVYHFFIDSAGAITVSQGEQYPATTEVSYESRAIDWPSVAGKACIGAMKIQTNGSAVFTPASTDLGATDVVDTFYNVGANYGAPVTI